MNQVIPHLKNKSLNFQNKDKTLIMGILNVTPDSFSDGGKYFDVDKAILHAKEMIIAGADIIDIGGESTRPGAEEVSINEELNRVIPVIKEISKLEIPISIDTYKPHVAEESIKAGANIINDISGLRNQEMVNIVAKNKVPIIIMHMKGTPKTMKDKAFYKDDVVNEIIDYLREKIQIAQEAGIKDIIIDPGIGFGKTVEHNIQILNRLNEFKILNKPILIGTSRKSFLGKLSGTLDTEKRLETTIASNVLSIINGANIIRVHDVIECKRAAYFIDKIISLQKK